MSITAGQDIIAADFVSSSAGASDSGKVSKLDAAGKIPNSFLRFGGTGADGALTITSGVTNIDLAGVAVVVKNYTSISITGTGSLTFTNPHANGTTIIFRSQGDVTITTSATRAIDIRSLGGTRGVGSTTNSGSPVTTRGGGGGASSINNGVDGGQTIQNTGASGADGAPGVGTGRAEQGYGGSSDTVANLTPNKVGSGYGGLAPHASGIIFSKLIPLTPGGGGGGGGTGSGGGGTAGDGGRGAGALYIECGGTLNITGTIDGSGINGTNGTHQGGGGGGGGTIIILYNFLTANTGTYTVTGGTGGTGTNAGGAGGLGYSLVASNTNFA